MDRNCFFEHILAKNIFFKKIEISFQYIQNEPVNVLRKLDAHTFDFREIYSVINLLKTMFIYPKHIHNTFQNIPNFSILRKKLFLLYKP